MLYEVCWNLLCSSLYFYIPLFSTFKRLQAPLQRSAAGTQKAVVPSARPLGFNGFAEAMQNGKIAMETYENFKLLGGSSQDL